MISSRFIRLHLFNSDKSCCYCLLINLINLEPCFITISASMFEIFNYIPVTDCSIEAVWPKMLIEMHLSKNSSLKNFCFKINQSNNIFQDVLWFVLDFLRQVAIFYEEKIKPEFAKLTYSSGLKDILSISPTINKCIFENFWLFIICQTTFSFC